MIKFDLFEVSAANAQTAARVENVMKDFFRKVNKTYKMYERASVERLYNDLTDRAMISGELARLGISNPTALANAFKGKFQRLMEAGWNVARIRTSPEDRMMKKQTSEPKIKLANVNTPISRTMVVYDANAPKDKNNIIKYDFKGKHNKSDRTQLNEIKMDWRNRTGNHYFNARPIFLSNYNKKYGK